MQWQIMDATCSGVNQLLIIQEQGENTPTVLTFPYDVTGVIFHGKVNFPTPILLSIGFGITVNSIVSYTGSISNNILTVSAISSGAIYIGMSVNGNGIAPGTIITGLGTGNGGVGTYIVNTAQVAASTALIASKVSMQLTSTQTQTVPAGQYAFDLWTVSPAMPPINLPVLNGFFEINEALTVIS